MGCHDGHKVGTTNATTNSCTTTTYVLRPPPRGESDSAWLQQKMKGHAKFININFVMESGHGPKLSCLPATNDSSNFLSIGTSQHSSLSPTLSNFHPAQPQQWTTQSPSKYAQWRDEKVMNAHINVTYIAVVNNYIQHPNQVRMWTM